MKGICYIIGAGDVEAGGCKASAEDYIICADAGYKFRDILGRECDLTVGDFDSLGEIPEAENKIVAPAEKDDTDMALAVFEGMKRGYRRFVILGALGGDRYDHSVANIQLLGYIAQNGATGYLLQGEKIFTCIKNSKIRFSSDCRGYISVFSFTDKSRDVTLKNLKYELSSYELINSRVLGVSNEFIGKEAEISVGDGMLLVYWTGRVSDII